MEALLYCEFDNLKGSMIMYQYPKMRISNELFETYSEFVITKTKLCGKIVSFKHEQLIFIGVPQCIEGSKYERNALLFNLVFVLDSTKLKREFPPECFKSIASKMSYYLRNLEIYTDLTTRQETSIIIDTAHSIHLKLIPLLKKPEAVHAHDVPMPIRNIQQLLAQQSDSWDMTLSQIVPYINGVSFVKQIAIQSNVHIEIVKKSLQHLLYFGCIKIVDIFQYSNMYAIRNTKIFSQLLSSHELQEELFHYCCSGLEKSSIPFESSQILHNILQLYCKFKPGVRVQDILEKYHHICQYINPKCLITFGLIKGFLTRVHEYPILMKEERQLVQAEMDNEQLEHDHLSHSLSPSSSTTFTVITRPRRSSQPIQVINMDVLRPYLNGKYSMDAICCELEITRAELLKSLDQFDNVQVINR
ncbi:hypothetical protein C9374_002042 [Naegleria lovaniensis]|uniref:Nitrogen permease regulator 2 n=1 Tax=Naegleria lovaniensis TaxID=51637 RepID=A0AA88GQI3_NAELO|nr:uncharacterized protein C9374_002042 [Naegleria lovaniensis]KAG2387007.1 hypothetical protein C9374_002042 [Naegleria lovaniensis]